MKKFPVTIVDDFFEFPDLVRDFALKQDFYKNGDGRWPGSRTNLLSDIDYDFFDKFSEKLLKLFFNFNTCELSWNIDSQFQRVSCFNENPNSSFNMGWIHSDSCIFSGVIYLNKDFPRNTGTNIYRIKNNIDNLNENQDEKFIFYSGEDISEKDYTEGIKRNNDQFEEIIRVENIYNRLVLFEGGQYHGVPSFYTGNLEDRLTLVFFVNNLNINNDLYPILRCKS
jgi:hypothetical protein